MIVGLILSECLESVVSVTSFSSLAVACLDGSLEKEIERGLLLN